MNPQEKEALYQAARRRFESCYGTDQTLHGCCLHWTQVGISQGFGGDLRKRLKLSAVGDFAGQTARLLSVSAA